VEERAAEAKRRAEEETARAEGLRKQLEALEMKHKMEIGALEKELDEAKRQVTQRSPPQSNIQNAEGVNLHPKVRRIGPDQLQSDDFVARRYFVHVSADRNRMTIRPHEAGSVVCVNGCLSLSSLGLVSSYDGPTDLPAEYSPAYGGYLVCLKSIS
jgi:hypothetical protein